MLAICMKWQIKGDVDYDAVKEIAGATTPVSWWRCLLTITMVLNNTLLAEKMRRGIHLKSLRHKSMS